MTNRLQVVGQQLNQMPLGCRAPSQHKHIAQQQWRHGSVSAALAEASLQHLLHGMQLAWRHPALKPQHTSFTADHVCIQHTSSLATSTTPPSHTSLQQPKQQSKHTEHQQAKHDTRPGCLAAIAMQTVCWFSRYAYHMVLSAPPHAGRL